MKEFNAFISYASEDRKDFVLLLAEKLRGIGLKIWFDEFCLRLGDSLREKIDYGLSNSDYGIVVLSHAFFSKKWPQRELNALYSLEIDGRAAILPIWKDISRDQVKKYSPLLADKYAAKAYDGIDYVAARLVEVIEPDNQYPQSLLQEELSRAKPQEHPGFDIKITWAPDYKVSSPNPYYDPKKTYVLVQVANWGTRDVIISKAGIHLQRKKLPFILADDSFIFGPRRLKDGDRADYLIEQNEIDLIDYAWAIDQVGRES
jgi:hypothetical protein